MEACSAVEEEVKGWSLKAVQALSRRLLRSASGYSEELGTVTEERLD